jgi:hypothetical protein
MNACASRNRRIRTVTIAVAMLATGLPVVLASQAALGTTPRNVGTPTYTSASAFDVSKPLRVLALQDVDAQAPEDEDDDEDFPVDTGYQEDLALQTSVGSASAPSTSRNFEGLRNTDNPFLVAPPDPVGDVGPNNYVEMVNLVFAVYNKQGTRLLGPTPLAALWADFSVPDCADESGDPVVLYDQFSDRWILSQFTTAGLDDPSKPFYNCIAVSTSGDPTGSYYRYAFTTGFNFPDYPKYGVWTDSYVITTREFGPTTEYGIGVYALEKNKVVNGDPKARAVRFFIDGNDPTLLPLVGDGLLPADIDGKQKPMTDTAIPLVGTQDDGAGYGATFDAVNIWDLLIKWRSTPTASLTLRTQLPTAPFDSVFPCGPDARDCLPQPGASTSQYLDILSYRQRPTHRLAYRNFKDYETLVTNQSVEALPGVAGVRWYEIRRSNGNYSIYQQGTFAPNDGVHRWMGSIAQDNKGDMGLGYSVVNGVNVYPGIRYTGRLVGDPLGQMTQGEGVIVNGAGIQQTTNSRWGDYTSMNIDPVDDCTFWYVNQYYTTTSLAGWQTRIASFKMPGC